MNQSVWVFVKYMADNCHASTLLTDLKKQMKALLLSPAIHAIANQVDSGQGGNFSHDDLAGLYVFGGKLLHLRETLDPSVVSLLHHVTSRQASKVEEGLWFYSSFFINWRSPYQFSSW